jgi:hypothetical protein
MRISFRYLVSIMLAFLCSTPMANTVTLPHDEFMPEDLFGLRTDRPDQILFEVRQYRLTLGTEARAGNSPAVQAGAWLYLDGVSLVSGSAVGSARVVLLEPGARLRPAQLDGRSGTLVLYYPQSMLEALLSLLSGPGPHYVQGRFYGNGTVWADLHAGPVPLPR